MARAEIFVSTRSCAGDKFPSSINGSSTEEEPMKARYVLGAAVAVAFTAAGCGSTHNPPPAAAGPATAAAGKAANNGSATSAAADPSCALAPQQMVRAALGGTVGQPSQTINHTSVATVVVCKYGSVGSNEVTIRFQTNENAATFAQAKNNFAANGQSTKTITGFEDEAYVSTISLTSNLAVTTLVARKGTLEIEVAALASLRSEEALEAKIFAAH
jgi:hypothetical protein